MFFSEPDAKKVAATQPPGTPVNQGNLQGGRPQSGSANSGGPPTGPNMGGGPPSLGGGPQINEDIKVPDKMVGLSKCIYHLYFQ